MRLEVSDVLRGDRCYWGFMKWIISYVKLSGVDTVRVYIYHISYVIIHKVDGAYTILYLVSQGDRQRYSQTNLQGGALVYDS